MNKMSTIKLDNWGKGLLLAIISKAMSSDRELTQDDLNKLKEIKKQLQDAAVKITGSI